MSNDDDKIKCLPSDFTTFTSLFKFDFHLILSHFHKSNNKNNKIKIHSKIPHYQIFQPNTFPICTISLQSHSLSLSHLHLKLALTFASSFSLFNIIFFLRFEKFMNLKIHSSIPSRTMAHI